MLNLAYPPVSFVPKGEDSVFMVYIPTDAGKLRFRSEGLIQGYWQSDRVRMRRIRIEFFMLPLGKWA